MHHHFHWPQETAEAGKKPAQFKGANPLCPLALLEWGGQVGGYGPHHQGVVLLAEVAQVQHPLVLFGRLELGL